MKLRINGNFLRFRLSKTEVRLFGTNGHVAKEIFFAAQPPKRFVYELVKSAVGKISAEYSDGKMTVFVPYETAEKWVESETVGFEGTQKIDDANELRILIEKDFAFLKPKLEDDSDNYPHPLKHSAENSINLV